MRGEKKVDGMSTLHIPRAQPVHMGRYICLEESSNEKASIYVYVKGRRMKLSVTECFSVIVELVCVKCAVKEIKSRASGNRLQGRAEEMFWCLSLQ